MTGTILKITKKIFQDEELPHKLFRTTKQTTKTRRAIAKNMLTDIKLSNAQLSIMISLGDPLQYVR